MCNISTKTLAMPNYAAAFLAAAFFSRKQSFSIVG
jgi:hypothetical protein